MRTRGVAGHGSRPTGAPRSERTVPEKRTGLCNFEAERGRLRPQWSEKLHDPANTLVSVLHECVRAWHVFLPRGRRETFFPFLGRVPKGKALEKLYLRMIKVPHNRAIELFEARLRDLASPGVDLQALKSRIQADAEQVFGPGSTQSFAAIGLPWVKWNMVGFEDAKKTYRQTLQGFISFIKDFHLISQEKVALSEEEYKNKYHDLLTKWNKFVPEYNEMLKGAEGLRKSLDDALAENRTLQQKISAEKPVPPVQTILFLGASPIDEVRLRLDQEVRDIEEALQITSLRDSFNLRHKWAVTADVLQRSMLENAPQIVHFSGHGGTAGIYVEDSLANAKLITNEAIGSLFEAFNDTVQCVVMNSCYSESQAMEIAKHVPYVIGMKRSVADAAAIAFSVGFYTALGSGKDIRFAFKMGQVRIKLEGVPDSDVPVLIG